MLPLGSLINNPGPVNPFYKQLSLPGVITENGPVPGMQGGPAPTLPMSTAQPSAPPVAMNQPPAGQEDHEQKVGKWKKFVQRFKTDPDLRMALAQFAVGLSQPANTWQEGVGRAVQASMQTMQALQQQHKEEAQQQTENEQKNRQIAVQEGELGTRKQQIGQTGEELAIRRDQNAIDREKLAQQNEQFTAEQKAQAERSAAQLKLQRDELAAKVKEIEGNEAYRRDALEVEKARTGQGSSAKMQEINSLAQTVLQTRPELFQDKDPKKQLAQATAYAWDILQGNDRASAKAKIMEGQMIMLPVVRADPNKDPQKFKQQTAAYNQAFMQLSQQTDALLDAAGITDTKLYTGTQSPQGEAPPQSTTQNQPPPQPQAQPQQPQQPAQPAATAPAPVNTSAPAQTPAPAQPQASTGVAQFLAPEAMPGMLSAADPLAPGKTINVQGQSGKIVKKDDNVVSIDWGDGRGPQNYRTQQVLGALNGQ